jgi:hypothetical protein
MTTLDSLIGDLQQARDALNNRCVCDEEFQHYGGYTSRCVHRAARQLRLVKAVDTLLDWLHGKDFAVRYAALLELLHYDYR